MPQIINTNIMTLNAQRNLNRTQSDLQVALQRLSSGLRINSAKDDAAGLAISERFTTQIRGLNQAIRNANDGISFAQTAEGALSTVGDALQRIRELGVQSINDTNSSSDRQALNNEVQQLIAEVNRVASSTQFNSQNILDGTLTTLTFQVGANQNQTIQVTGVDSRASQLGARTSESGSISQNDLNATISNNDVVINGVAIDLSGLAADDTIEDVISAVNAQQADTGVQALKATSVDSGDLATLLSVGTGVDGVMTINDVAVAVKNDGSDGVDLDVTAANINALSTQTGVTAVVTGGAALNLQNTNGQVIELAGANFDGGTAETYSAGLVLASEVQAADFSVAGTFDVVTGGTASATALGGAQANNVLNGVDVLTASTANDALLTLDFALQQVNGLRAELGAVQIRFESTIANLSVSVENQTAARSRIRDADFAAETAALTRAQILQQAGVAMVAQANVLPQAVLALLQ